MLVFWMMYDDNYVLCEVAIVSQLLIPFLFITWDCVKMTLLATNHNAVMPPSRASTRGRYSRIVGVTVEHKKDEPRAWNAELLRPFYT